VVTLTASETKHLRLLSYGLSANEACGVLHVAYQTVKYHRKNVLRKLGAKNAAHAVALGYEAGLLR
jgi:DNA-binding CsgD family transcriptional regulator